jgi:hypothetical protein
MKLIEYINSAGNFDYRRYRDAQIAANHAKINAVWVCKPSIQFLSRYILKAMGKPAFGLCHGTRRGLEQAWFRECLGGNVEVIGTEISDTAAQFPHTVRHDFHERRPEWVNAASFVYSNSWDHAYDPAKALFVRMESLRPGGVVILEHTIGHRPENASESDPFGIAFDDLVNFVNMIGGGRFYTSEVLDKFDFDVPDYYGQLKYLVIRNRESLNGAIRA